VEGGGFAAKGMATVTAEIPLENPVDWGAIFKRALFRVADFTTAPGTVPALAKWI
jgi:hypothetical protein